MNQEHAAATNQFSNDEGQAIEDDGRQPEQEEADEPDAPTAAEENEGMSTILSADPLFGVQDDASDE